MVSFARIQRTKMPPRHRVEGSPITDIRQVIAFMYFILSCPVDLDIQDSMNSFSALWQPPDPPESLPRD
ncbi:MAG: hypothetical protein L0228_18120 [Planctomycetes bacterium]|nr:hypothetical protein [Planctomycetota bacterium]